MWRLPRGRQAVHLGGVMNVGRAVASRALVRPPRGVAAGT
ncbi:hypothetical protein SAMN04244581_04260 [Paracoccus denitrificans]|jgi:hypothetical protein|nr:hypothetical protein [Paracoccus denitrificans]SDJ56790.1 hypothetical protein SAMN04244581_04260 [Paracoccus denitrificans]SFR20235.1 hypothetical protein SAMN04244569_04323 [Paracoccus denitrificans]